MMRHVNSVRQTGGRHFPLVMPGQKRVEDARERAYDPGIHLLRKTFYEDRWIAGSSPAMTRRGLGRMTDRNGWYDAC